MRVAAGCVAVVITGAVLACAGPAEEAQDGAPVAATGEVAVTPELLSAGREAYRKYCVQCHGISGKGDGTSAAHLIPPPRDHTNAELMDPISDAVIGETILFGGVSRGFPNMPAFPHVQTEELVALVAYTRSLSRPEVARVDFGDVD